RLGRLVLMSMFRARPPAARLTFALALLSGVPMSALAQQRTTVDVSVGADLLRESPSDVRRTFGLVGGVNIGAGVARFVAEGGWRHGTESIVDYVFSSSPRDVPMGMRYLTALAGVRVSRA